jgi:hypothetical protein
MVFATHGNYAFTPQSGVSIVLVEAWGAGGGGGGCDAAYGVSGLDWNANGGGGGSYGKTYVEVTPSTIYAVTVGWEESGAATPPRRPLEAPGDRRSSISS